MVLAQEAKETAATRRKKQSDRHSFTARRIKDKIKNSQDKAANKKNAAATAAKVASAVAAAPRPSRCTTGGAWEEGNE